VIRSFRDKDTEKIFNRQFSKRLQQIVQPARRRLEMLDAAKELTDLLNPPSNHLEVLQGDRAGQHSIRINMQYRICFVWKEPDAFDVEIVDYHD
jgi:proteic killer suppression protein